jgi:hypothetical protein
MSRLTRLIDALSVPVAIAFIVVGFLVLHHQGGQIKGTQRDLAVAQGDVRRTASALATKVRQEHEQRLVTVGQRCEFTRLVTHLLVEKDHADAAPFVKSYEGCEKQLAKLRQR